MRERKSVFLQKRAFLIRKCTLFSFPVSTKQLGKTPLFPLFTYDFAIWHSQFLVNPKKKLTFVDTSNP